jgi:AMMECR1 domain-containing protein
MEESKDYIEKEFRTEIRNASSDDQWKRLLRSRVEQKHTLHALARLAISKLEQFDSNVLVAGVTSMVPLVEWCVVLGNGRYRLSAVPSNASGTEVSRVVIVFDHLTSVSDAIAVIRQVEDLSLPVEGILAISASDSFYGGMLLKGMGYRSELILEQPTHFTSAVAITRIPDDNSIWDSERLKDNLDPTEAVRKIAEHYLATGKLLIPPKSFDKAYIARGGVWVSLRRRYDDWLVARGGFWMFDQDGSTLPMNVVRATYATLAGKEELVKRQWNTVKISVTLIEYLDPALPQKMNHEKYGIVVRTYGLTETIGYAPPNGQGICSDMEQYRHASSLARIPPYITPRLYIYLPRRLVEPNERWLHFGVPCTDDHDLANTAGLPFELLARVFSIIQNEEQAEKNTFNALSDISCVVISIYTKGHVGCVTSWRGTFEERLTKAARGAIQDGRIAGRINSADDIDGIVISLLYSPMRLKGIDESYFARTIQRGLNAFSVQQHHRFGVFTESVIPHYCWSTLDALKQLLRKAGIPGGTVTWASYRSTSWIRTRDQVRPLKYGFPVRTKQEYSIIDDRQDASALAEYIFAHRGEHGLPVWRSFPVTGINQSKGRLSQALHALYALLLAGEMFEQSNWTLDAKSGIGHCLDRFCDEGDESLITFEGWETGWATNVLLLLAACDKTFGTNCQKIYELEKVIERSIRIDGTIARPGSKSPCCEDQDYLPGATILALALFATRTGVDITNLPFSRSLAWYRRRFTILHPWGMVIWHPLAWAALYHLQRRPEYASFTFEIVDWVLNYQLEHNGAFLTNLIPFRPSFHTACIAHGVTAAWLLAKLLGDKNRERVYANSWIKAMGFMRQLFITEEDMFCMRDRRAVGGVRLEQSSSEVRIDYVSHSLLALLEGITLRDIG